MYPFWLFLFWGSLGLAGLALILTLFNPKYRKELLTIKSTRATLEERYAKELAAGTAVIIPKNPAALKKLVFLIICGGIFVLIFQKFKIYIDSLQQTCTVIGGWNSLIFFLGSIFIVLGIPMLFVLRTSYKTYNEIIEDGFVPSRKSNEAVDRISFKLTKWLKIREQLRLIGGTTCCILLMSSPLLLLYTLTNSPTHKITSIYSLNDRLQKSCLADLKKRS